MADAIAEDVAVRATRLSWTAVKRRVLLQPRHEAAAGLVKLRPPAIVVVAEVEDVGGAGLDRHGFGRRDVVDVGRRHRKVDRSIGIGIVDDVRLGAAHVGRKGRPIRAQTGSAASWWNRSAGPHPRSSAAARDAPAPASGVNRSPNTCHGRSLLASDSVVARHRRGAEVIEPCLVARHRRHDLAQARGAAELAVQQRNQLPFRAQLARQFIRAVLLHKPIEVDARERASIGREIRYSGAAWLDPSPCPKTSPNA